MTIRVASVPAAHPYVVGIRSNPKDTSTSYLTDPVAEGRPARQWWPPVMIDPRWITRHESGFDLMHAHFGLESFSIPHLERVLSTLARAGRPFIYTVHDLVNPQLVDQRHHERQLDLLMQHADALVTLTEGAAAEIQSRWGRSAEVILHPHVLPLSHRAVATRAHSGFVVGMHLKDLRPNVDAVAAVHTLIDAVAALRAAGEPVTARIDLDDRVRDAAVQHRVQQLCAATDFVTLVQHPHLDDAALFSMLSGLDVCVLPYGFGTHSGWLELCFDLGVPVAIPNVGYYAEQHRDPAFAQSFTMGSGPQLADAILRLICREEAAEPQLAGSTARADAVAARRVTRLQQSAAVAARHLELYRRVIARSEGQH